MTEKEICKVRLSATDGFRYVSFEPPVEGSKLNGMPYPQTSILNETHSWTPTSIYSRHGQVSSMGWMGEAFNGNNENFARYTRQLAEHIGGIVLNPVDIPFISAV